ncbi:hypothetical protein EYZ11_007593 [Aspergillus tanneri]|uniref:Putative secondary metabolism biosynthetic enzyme n=1 Tax=Aspergillus tanneri TaxID=1220188 RepID=A0A4S3JCL2_9EURO|nr:putative secondary metabolism biosynthetic enzyme [Aspergillus tanneri]KAA8652865.1 putative secondary metabolism biosynthetic enzyme [Aspergillus tanneri]THC92923.1 hypothetical protein EYZ11_007593 [Aspergillus tanneri]
MAPIPDSDLVTLLHQSAAAPTGLVVYADGNRSPPTRLSYAQLRDRAAKGASWLRGCPEFRSGAVTLVHFKSHLDNIVWFWATLLAGSVPALSTPLANTSEARCAHFQHLHDVLKDPLVLTLQQLRTSDFAENVVLRVVAVDAESDGHGYNTMNGYAKDHPRKMNGYVNATNRANKVDSLDGVAALMLTSGSSGNSKVVCLTHQQIFASIRGKLAAMPEHEDGAVLNWVGLDHVGSLMETHLRALYARVDQVQMPAIEALSRPLMFLRLLTRHRVAMTFAPDFFLRKLVSALDTASADETQDIDLRHLRYLVSGGEPNAVDTGLRLTEHLRRLGLQYDDVITPGFGMTETCAGSIYNRQFPVVDLQTRRDIGSLGTCVPGIEMRISPVAGNHDPTAPGILELRGPIVFSRYLHNEEATRAAFTQDGWFQTGDLATIDERGHLMLTGRLKELININSVKYLPHEIEIAIHQACIPGVAPTFVACFSYQPDGAHAEEVYVVYQHEYSSEDAEARISALHAIVRTVLLFTSARPRVLPLPPGRLDKTTLGKLSRTKIQMALARGVYRDQEETNERILREYRSQSVVAPRDEMERTLRDLVLQTLGLSEEMQLGIDTPILDTGINSADLIRLKRATEIAFGIDELPMITVMTHTTIRSLVAAIRRFQSTAHTEEYQPVVTLQPSGSNTPLWLFHPGVGEILVFLALAPYFPERPIYAMRPRGFNRGETTFDNLEELVTTYYAAMRARQPRGPYALAGYSYGSMLAFQIAQRLEADGETVQFLGCLNLPPHIKQRMRRLDWTAGLLHIAHFCAIIPEERSRALMTELRGQAPAVQVARVFAEGDAQRTAELGLTPSNLQTWTDVAFSLQRMGWDYDPTGSVATLDVFFCDPLSDVAGSREEYRQTKLNRWADYVREDLRFHEVDGAHYTMLSTEHVGRFQQTLKKALAERGL